ncbi:hypothetical protein IQ06DRAFT_123258 [Phaeosphaeriaceae sp. SRC1lsM3a]|nr:hypothetical protein IQ06DRAFT_123258 [Stagonospora sp. SRC1lsM3a]
MCTGVFRWAKLRSRPIRHCRNRVGLACAIVPRALNPLQPFAFTIASSWQRSASATALVQTLHLLAPTKYSSCCPPRLPCCSPPIHACCLSTTSKKRHRVQPHRHFHTISTDCQAHLTLLLFSPGPNQRTNPPALSCAIC